MKSVISTLTADTRYSKWVTQAGLNTVERSVLIKGGAGVARLGRPEETPQGTRTEISDEDADFLQNHNHFKDHMKRGFVRIVSKAPDPDKAAQSMEKDKGSAPKTADDVKATAEAKEKPDGTPPLQVVTNKGK